MSKINKKNYKIEVRLNEFQNKALNRLVKNTGFNKSEIIRYLIIFQSHNIPSKKDIQKLLKELSNISDLLNDMKFKDNIDDIKKILNKLYELMNNLENFKK